MKSWFIRGFTGPGGAALEVIVSLGPCWREESLPATLVLSWAVTRRLNVQPQGAWPSLEKVVSGGERGRASGHQWVPCLFLPSAKPRAGLRWPEWLLLWISGLCRLCSRVSPAWPTGCSTRVMLCSGAICSQQPAWFARGPYLMQVCGGMGETISSGARSHFPLRLCLSSWRGSENGGGTPTCPLFILMRWREGKRETGNDTVIKYAGN